MATMKKMMKTAETGKSLKAVDKSKNPGLSKLPTEVRNKMGYQKDGGKTKMKAGGMIKRADGSSSPRGLWDNIRAAAKRNKASGKPGKKPTSAMLKQEKKIKAKTK